MHFSRLAIVAALALSLSACSTSVTTNTESTANRPPIETTVPQATTGVDTTESVKYYISEERRALMRGALQSAGQILFDKLDEGIPYQILSLEGPTYAELTGETDNFTGWVLLTTSNKVNQQNADAHISMRVFVVDGQIDRSKAPLSVYVSSHGSKFEILGETEFSNGAPLRNYPTAFSWSWTDTLDKLTQVIPRSHEGMLAVNPYITETWDVNIYKDQFMSPASVDAIKAADENLVASVVPAILDSVKSTDWQQ